MQLLNMLMYTAITLGVLIFIHELGHFLAAKLTGMRVDRFSIGFPPRAFGIKIGETDYCISWIPVGGYVKIAGMIDESFDTDFLRHPPQLWEFRARPLGARMLVICAGVIMNVFLAISIFWAISFVNGKVTKETTEIGYVAEGSPAAQSGILPGDKILSINGKPVMNWEEVENLLYIENLGNDIRFDIERNGHRQSLVAPRRSPSEASEKPFGIVEAHLGAEVKAVEPALPAQKLGLRPGDILISLDSLPVGYPQVSSMIRERAGRTVTVRWKRGGEVLSGTTTIPTEGRIGIVIEPVYEGPTKRIHFSFFGALPEGIAKTGQSVYLFYLTISKIIAGKASIRDSFGGPIAIAQLATRSAEYGVVQFLEFMAVLSMSLAILNILPIPALDGGHLAMMLYEKAFKREIPHRVKLVIQQAGFILLLLFMAFVIYNDLSRF
ncbi:MAG: RIP metalloprotease RseP [Ignavibacteria bacterium]|nr:MAG: RIP metalloprotease RseP [Ignavibacteria bacterium]